MGILMDEFSSLLGDEEITDDTYMDESLSSIDKAKSIVERESFYGINAKKLEKQFKYEPTKLINWEHVTFVIDTNNLVSISNNDLEELRVFDFIEEIDCIGEKGIGFNNHKLNKLREVVIPSSVLVINNFCFAFHKKLRTVVFEEDSRLVYLGHGAFAYCEQLKTVDLTNCYELEQLGRDVFSHSGVKTIKLNDNIHEFDKDVFRDSQVEKIYINGYEYSRKEFEDSFIMKGETV